MAWLKMATVELEEVEGHFTWRAISLSKKEGSEVNKSEHGRGTKYNRYPE